MQTSPKTSADGLPIPALHTEEGTHDTLRLARAPVSPEKRWSRALPLVVACIGLSFSGCTADDADKDGVSASQGDCDDNDATSFPGAPELCDDKDNDCNGVADDSSYYYRDEDGDGFGNPDMEQPDCKKPSGYVESSGDCNDKDPNSRPGATEVCDQKDNNCDGAVDENLGSVTYFQDLDGDGYGTREDFITACAQPDGYADQEDDCDDTNPARNPDENEKCDAIDNNCNDLVDEGYPIAPMFPDTDLDGYGADVESILACATAVGYSPLNADCDDTDKLTNPNADERCEGTDNNCNGIVDENLRYLFFKDGDGDGFGSTEVNTCNPATDEVGARGDCKDDDPSVHPGALDPGNDNKDSDCGGTDFPEPHVLLSSTSSPVIKAALAAAQDGETIWVGPGVFIDGDLSCYGKHIQIKSTHLANRTLIDAGGFSRVFYFTSAEDNDCVVDGFTMTNGVQDSGGAIYVSNSSSPTISHNLIVQNKATHGGGAYVSGNSSPIFTNNTFIHNTASNDGGGITVSGATPTFTNNLIIGNTLDINSGDGLGGGVNVDNARPNFLNNTIVGNRAAFGGGLYISGTNAGPTVQNSIVAYNSTDNVYLESGAPSFAYSVLFNKGFLNHNLPTVASSVKVQDPGLVSYYNGMDVGAADFHLIPSSTLHNAGNPATTNPDDSRADIGVYGGSNGEMGYYDDKDSDGLSDGWEYRYGFSTSSSSASADPDGDGLTNLQEINASTDPKVADCDADGEKDGEEVSAGADANDWFSRKSAPAGITVQVPGDFDTLQAAFDKIRWSGNIELTNSLYSEVVTLDARVASLAPASGVDVTLASTDGSLITTKNALLNLSDLNFEGSTGLTSSALHMHNSRGTLLNLSFKNNVGEADGGAVYMRGSGPSFEDCTFEGNEGKRGGAVFMDASRASFSQVDFLNNKAQFGGAVFVINGGKNSIDASLFAQNQATEGGALYLAERGKLALSTSELTENEILDDAQVAAGIRVDDAILTIDECSIHDQRASRGAALYMDNNSYVDVIGSMLYDNVAQDVGGAIWTSYSTLLIHQSAIYDNLATNTGAGLFTHDSVVTVTNDVFVHNISGVHGAGIMQDGPDYYWSSCNDLTVENTILAWNEPDNMYVYLYNNDSPCAVTNYSDLYNPGGTNTNDTIAGIGNINADPLFVGYDSDNGVYDFHLQSGSPAINTGNSGTLDADGTRSDMGIYGDNLSK